MVRHRVTDSVKDRVRVRDRVRNRVCVRWSRQVVRNGGAVGRLGRVLAGRLSVGYPLCFR